MLLGTAWGSDAQSCLHASQPHLCVLHGGKPPQPPSPCKPVTLRPSTPTPALPPPPQAYEGNRAPVPIYMHMPWMTQTANQKYVQKFMDYVLDKPDQDVWVSRS